MKKVYFAGSIRGGREDAGLYRRLIQYIQKDNIVLTEHIGDLSLSKTESLGDSAIYEQDTAWLRESDLVIAECSTPSLGVGTNSHTPKPTSFRSTSSTTIPAHSSPLC